MTLTELKENLQLLRTGKAGIVDTWRVYEALFESVANVETQTLDDAQTQLDALKGLWMVIKSITGLAKVFNNLIEHFENQILAHEMAEM